MYVDLEDNGPRQEFNAFSSSRPPDLIPDIPVVMTEKDKVNAASRMLRQIPECAKIHPIPQATENLASLYFLDYYV